MKIVVPPLAEGVNEATITLWLVQEGATLGKDQDVVEMATDKATFTMPSPAAGILKKIIRGEGETVKVGEPIGELL
ncbi:MAG: lipoyl domain-containing protein [Candidatus Omnitrophica bacterium]|nr:lipoyl domain-containing protein [Candidatus Omnitrophota bacterium]